MAGVVAQQLRALATLLLLQEDPNIELLTAMLFGSLHILTSSSRSGLDSVDTCSHAHTLHITKKKVLFFSFFKGSVMAPVISQKAETRLSLSPAWALE